MALHVELVSPERILFTGDADMVTCRTAGGDIAFLSGHTPFLGALGIGIVRIALADGGEQRAAVHGGFVQVRNDQVIILSDVADLPDMIDVERARESAEAAERQLREEHSAECEATLRRAHVRLELAGVG